MDVRLRFEAIARQMREQAERKEFDDAFGEASDLSLKIARMPNAELAKWQLGYSETSPQNILAQHEWQRRLVVMQVKATRFAAWLGIIGVVIGAILGAALTYLAGQVEK